MSSEKQAHGFRDAILQGEVDNHLDLLIDAIKDRRSIIAQTDNAKKKGSFKAGDKVKVIDMQLRPKYLRGAIATVDHISPTGFIIVHVAGKGWKFEPRMLEKVDG